jgi:hypothetical protein
VYATAEPTLTGRINNELGGAAKYRLTAKDGLVLSNGRLVDVEVVASALVAFPHELAADARVPIVNTLVFAHAAALAEEKKQGKPGAYGTQFMNVPGEVGWVLRSESEATLAADEVLASTLAAASSAGIVFSALQITSP